MLIDIVCTTEEEFKKMEAFLFGLEFSEKPSINNISIFYSVNHLTYLYKLEEYNGKWYIVTE